MSKKKVNVDEIKFKNTQKEILNITNQFRQHLFKHFEIVEIKSKKLIDERWINTE